MTITIELEGDNILRATTSSGRSYRLDTADAGYNLLWILQAEKHEAKPAIDFAALPKLIISEWKRLPGFGKGAELKPDATSRPVKQYDAKGKRNSLLELKL